MDTVASSKYVLQVDLSGISYMLNFSFLKISTKFSFVTGFAKTVPNGTRIEIQIIA